MRYLLMVLLVIILVVLIFVLIKLIKISNDSRTHKIIKNIFKEMENEYENYIKTKLNLEIISSEDFNIDKTKLVNEISTILEPYIEDLWTLANSEQTTVLPDSEQDIKYFKNLYFLTNKFLKQTLPLSALDKQEMQNALYSALKADVSKRLLKLQSGF